MRIKHPYFVFDLDSTVTKCELLPLLAREAGLEEEMRLRTERAMRGEVEFAADFRQRALLLNAIPIDRARRIIQQAPIHEDIAAFLRSNRNRCYILTGNLDAWIEGLLERLNMLERCLCSRAIIENNRLYGIKHILDKGEAMARLPRPIVAIGDGSNDIPMFQSADYSIAFGGARTLTPEVRAAADLSIEDEGELCRRLNAFL